MLVKRVKHFFIVIDSLSHHCPESAKINYFTCWHANALVNTLL